MIVSPTHAETYNDGERDTKVVHQTPIAFQLLLVAKVGQLVLIFVIYLGVGEPPL